MIMILIVVMFLIVDLMLAVAWLPVKRLWKLQKSDGLIIFSVLMGLATIVKLPFLIPMIIQQRDAVADLHRQGYKHVLALSIQDQGRTAKIQVGDKVYDCDITKLHDHWGITSDEDCSLKVVPGGFIGPSELGGGKK